MEWQLDTNAPIYSQLVNCMTLGIASGGYKSGERLPAVRELAVDAGVNPNTMQRALQELERSGLVYSQRTAGRFVTEDKAVIDKARKELAEENIKKFLDSMSRLGFMRDEIVSLVENEIREDKRDADI